MGYSTLVTVLQPNGNTNNVDRQVCAWFRMMDTLMVLPHGGDSSSASLTATRQRCSQRHPVKTTVGYCAATKFNYEH